MPESFRNPYHFVPASSATGPGAVDLATWDDPKKAPRHVSHREYATDGFSGRIVCRLRAESPLVVGAEQTKGTDGLRIVAPFRIDGRPAIPSSTLRGLISAMAEAASNSALRILDADRHFSFRREMRHGLSAIGMVMRRDDRYFLRPLCLPHIQAPMVRGFRLSNALPEGGAGKFTTEMFPQPVLKTYLGRGEKAPRGGPDTREIKTPKFLADHPTFRADDPNRFHWVHLAADPAKDWRWGTNESLPDRAWHRTKEVPLNGQPGKLLLAQVEARGQPGFRVRGIYRTLGVTSDRMEEIPGQKKHELFIPYTDEMEAQFDAHARNDGTWQPGMWREFPIHDEAVQRFHALADERTAEFDKKDVRPDKLLPFHPHGTARNEEPNGRKLRLKTGDLVFFRPDDAGHAIAEISFSSIWRGRVEHLDNGEPVTAADFFASINPNLPPIGSHAARTAITIAEQLFGFVEEGPHARHKHSRALASRVKFGFGLPSSGNPPKLEPAIVLKILASPKPPCPNFYFYFKSSAGKGIQKQKMALRPSDTAGRPLPGRTAVQPQGRKFYLHQPDWESQSSPPWETSAPDFRCDQKAKVQPLEKGSEFFFHLDFENLSRLELGLLCYALKPTDKFEHKLGMGKPLGLGSVRIDPLAILLVDRHSRYRTDALTAPRWHHVWKPDAIDGKPLAASWPDDVYKPERAVEPAPSTSPEERTFPAFHKAFRDAMHAAAPEVLAALEQIGNPASSKGIPVHYPPSNGGSTEDKLFEWFVGNDRRGEAAQHLTPLPAKILPTLARNNSSDGRHPHPKRDAKRRG